MVHSSLLLFIKCFAVANWTTKWFHFIPGKSAEKNFTWGLEQLWLENFCSKQREHWLYRKMGSKLLRWRERKFCIISLWRTSQPWLYTKLCEENSHFKAIIGHLITPHGSLLNTKQTFQQMFGLITQERNQTLDYPQKLFHWEKFVF